METKSVNVFGDEIRIRWDGNVWVSPHNGQQHSHARDAMRSELEAYYRASGEDPEDEDTADDIDEHLSQMVSD